MYNLWFQLFPSSALVSLCAPGHEQRQRFQRQEKDFTEACQHNHRERSGARSLLVHGIINDIRQTHGNVEHLAFQREARLRLILCFAMKSIRVVKIKQEAGQCHGSIVYDFATVQTLTEISWVRWKQLANAEAHRSQKCTANLPNPMTGWVSNFPYHNSSVIFTSQTH